MKKDCFARYDKDISALIVGNGRIEKKVIFKGSFVRTVSVLDKTNDTEWKCGSALWQRCPILGETESPKIDVNIVECDEPFGMKPHLKAIVTLCGERGTVWYEYTVFDDIPFVFGQIFVEQKERIGFDATDGESDKVSYSGIEADYSRGADGEFICGEDTIDCIPIGRVHIEVESVKLYDKTDGNDSLVERLKTPIYKSARRELDGNIFCINDYPSGNSLMLIKHSPTQSSALNRKGCDLIMQGSSFAVLRGNGIDFSNIPSGKVPYYASAIGVAKSEDIHNELWRYNTAMTVSDPRRSLFIMSNTWGDRSQDIAVCESFMIGEIKRAVKLGVDIIQIDDGWQSGVTANSRRRKGGVWEGYYKDDPNFWQINPEKFPNGLTPLVEMARGYGIEIGLWFSPDSSYDFVNVDKDIETILSLYNKYGIRYYKLDGVKIRNKTCEMRFIYLLEELTKRTGGDIRFNLDVTAEDRFGYLYHPEYGTLFVENRYTDFTSYFPHNTFKNLWNLASVIPTRRLQMELLNIRRNSDKYKGMPFAPSTYKMDYVFGVVMPANPLVWMEMTGLEDADAALLSKITEVYKKYAEEFFASRVIPIGNAPNGMTFSGYLCDSENYAHLLLFRESAAKDTFTYSLTIDIADKKAETLYNSASVDFNISGAEITVRFSEERSFVWLRVAK